MSLSSPNEISRSPVNLVYSSVSPASEFKRDLAPIVLLHGMFCSKQYWKFLMQDLANLTGRKVYAVDMRNHGESPWSDEFDLELLSLDLDHFLEQHNIAKAILVGHSLGAKTVMTFVLQKPQKAEKVVLEDMYVKNIDEYAAKVVREMFQALKQILALATDAGDIDAALTTLIETSSTSNTTMQDMLIEFKKANKELDVYPIKKEGERYIWQGNLDVLEKTLHEPGYYNQSLKGEYRGDALFIYGTKSFLDVASDLTITQFFPRAQLVGIEGASHDVHTLFAEKFLAEVVKFINS